MSESSILQTSTDRKLPPNAGKGRKQGVPNKVTKELKEMILGALDDAGGQKYLLTQAHENPNAFMALIGKVLPMQLKADVNGNFNVTILTGVPSDKNAD